MTPLDRTEASFVLDRSSIRFGVFRRHHIDSRQMRHQNHRFRRGHGPATCVVLAMAWAIVAMKGKLGKVRSVRRGELGFLAASGLATGASWLFYYYAISAGQVSVVVQIDKLSVLVSVPVRLLRVRRKVHEEKRRGPGAHRAWHRCDGMVDLAAENPYRPETMGLQ